jgi:hypothetical protein
MSLQNLAHHLQTAGRGDDTMLVHMTPKEVAGLQTLAAAHGGSLTVNPETGLPEAGILSSMLPMIIGAALAPATGGASLGLTSAWETAAVVGGAYGLATGSLQKGLMAGLGAYGGAGLGASLAGNAMAAAPAVTSTAVPPPVFDYASMGATAPAAATAASTTPAALQAVTAPGATGMAQPYMAAAQTAPTNATQLQQAIANAGSRAGTTTAPIVQTTPVPTTAAPQSVMDAIKQRGTDFMSGLQRLGSGTSETFDDKEKLKKLLSENKLNLMASYLSAANMERPQPPRERRYPMHHYDYSRTVEPSPLPPGSTAERMWFAADGGIASLPVENMSQQNAAMDNTRYPMAMQSTPTYALPSERPISQNVVYPATDAGVTPYSGTATFATGGITALADGGLPAKYKYLEKENLAKNLRVSDVGDIKGDTYGQIGTNWDTEIQKQQKEAERIKTIPGIATALKSGIPEVVAAAQAIVDKEVADVTQAQEGRTKSLDAFNAGIKRTGTSIGTRGITSTTPPPSEEKEYVLDASGKFVEKKPTATYTKLTKADALSGWDTTKDYLEPDEVTRVFEEVAGRRPTEAELSKYVGSTKLSMADLANAVNKLPDVKEKRTFSDNDLQEQAKYYWGRDLTKGELAAFKAKNYSTFGAVRDAFTGSSDYVDYLNKLNQEQFTKENTPVAGPANMEGVSSVFYDTLQRRPSGAELNALMAKNLSAADLKKELQNSNEYVNRFLLYTPNSDKFVGDLTPYVTSTGNVTTGGTTTGGTTTGGTTTGDTTTLPAGGGSGFVPPVTYTPLSQAQLEEFKKKYREYTPQTYETTTAGAAANLVPEVSQSIYTPLGATGALPKFTVPGAMPTYSPEETLGLDNMYRQLAEKMPDLSTGLSFTPGQAQLAASPFADTSPGIVTLQSAEKPKKYTEPATQTAAPASPILPGTTTQVQGLTPEQQAILSSYQQYAQNKVGLAAGGATGGVYDLGDYSDGGRLLKGPGDGVSDSIPASINDRRPARLADGEFVIPARIVSELGNGSTEAGARQLYAMMDRIQKRRKKSMGKGKVAVDSKARKMLPV